MPVGLALANGGNLFVLDEAAFESGAIFQVDVSTGGMTVLTNGNLFNHPVDMSVDAKGNLIVVNQNVSPNNFGFLVSVDRQTGAETFLTGSSRVMGPDVTSGYVNQSNGLIYVGATHIGSSPAQIFSWNPATQVSSALTQGSNLDLVNGVFVYFGSGGGDAPVPRGGSSSAAVVAAGPMQANGTSVAPVARAASSGPSTAVPPTAVPVQPSRQANDGSRQTSDADQAGGSTAAIDGVLAGWATDRREAPLGILQGIG